MGELRYNAKKCQNSFETFSSVIQKFWGLLAVGTTVVLGIKATFEKFGSVIREFETSFTNVLTLLSDNDKKEFGVELKNGALDIMKNYGTSIEDTNKALFDAVSAGIPASEAIQFLDKAAKLAVGGVTSLGVAVDGTTSILNAYGLSAGETDKVTAAFFSAQKAGKTTVEELVTSIGKVAPTAASVGISFQETLSVISVLTTKGIKTAEAVTQIKSALSGLLKPSKEAEEVLRQYGVPVGATAIKATGLTNTLKALNSMYQQNADALSKAIPSVEGYNAIAALSGETLETYSSVLQQVNEDIGENSSLNKAAAEKQETVEQKLKKSRDELEAFILDNEDLNEIYLTSVNAQMGFVKAATAVGKILLDNMWTVLAMITTFLSWKMVSQIVNASNNSVAFSTTLVGKATNFATTAFKNFTNTLKANALGLVLTALPLLINWISKFNKELDVNARVTKKASENWKREAENVNFLYKSVKNTNLSLEKRKQALEELKKIAPQYNAQLTEEGKLINDNKIALDDYIKKLEEKAVAEAFASERAEVYKKKIDIETSISQKEENYKNTPGEDHQTIVKLNFFAKT